MSEIGKQLQKLPEFEENIKNLLIPILNFYLNLNQLDVDHTWLRQKSKQVKNWAYWLTTSTIRIGETMSWSTSSRWPMTMIARITASWLYSSLVAWVNASAKISANSSSDWKSFLWARTLVSRSERKRLNSYLSSPNSLIINFLPGCFRSIRLRQRTIATGLSERPVSISYWKWASFAANRREKDRWLSLWLACSRTAISGWGYLLINH